MRHFRSTAVLAQVILLSACASDPLRPSRPADPAADPVSTSEPTSDAGPPSTRTPPKSAANPTARAPAAPPAGAARQESPGQTSRRGAYYMDDGPGIEPAPDHRAIPNAQPRREPLLTRANRPYVVFGRAYQPMTALVPYRQRGHASWYGRKFHGQKTASGEVYNMYSMTAAHPTLPIPSYVKVTNTRSGEQVVVRVNDRGPFLNDRLIDLSYTAAAKLGYVQAGSTEVEVELISWQDLGPANPIVQVAQVATAAPAALVAQSLASAGKPNASLPGPITPTGSDRASGASAAAGIPAKVDEVREERLQLEITVKQDQGSPIDSAKASTDSVPPTALAANRPSASAELINPAIPGKLATAGKAAASGNTAVIGNAAATSQTAATGNPAEPVSSAVLSAPSKTAAPGAVSANKPNLSQSGVHTYLQLGAFSAAESAESVRAKVRKDLEWIKHPIEIVNEAGLFKLRTGPFESREDANLVAEKIRVATGSRPFTTTR